ncbi:MAG: DUF6504 family protein [Actinomycetota bacterium]|nr:DUF6504 family protein [Actinomycetota bacterium]
MGRNTAIKKYDSHAHGQTLDLLSSKEGRLPVMLELLRSPWITRASELVAAEDAGLGKRISEAVAVAWDERRGCPAAFEWRARTYRIDAVVQTWAIERRWWNPRGRVSRRCWRVLARGGTYDLAFDRLTRSWLLVGMQD